MGPNFDSCVLWPRRAYALLAFATDAEPNITNPCIISNMGSRSEFYERFALPLSTAIIKDPEILHHAGINLLKSVQNSPIASTLLEKALIGERFKSERLQVNISGITLESPIVLAAGFDKNAECINSLYSLGFSSIVAGTVVRNKQTGNPPPRIFRPQTGSLLNHMGFPSEGINNFLDNLEKYKNRNYPLGVSIGINKNVAHSDAPNEYAYLAQSLHNLADYLEINVSSPNTPGLRNLQDKFYLRDILDAIRQTTMPIFVKVSPDLNKKELDEIIDLCLEYNCGIVATNTSIDQTLKNLLSPKYSQKPGGLSGKIIYDRSNEVLSHIHSESNGKIELVGAGGIQNAQDAIQKIKLGAKSLQVYTGFIYKGPSFANDLNQQIDAWLTNNGVDSINQIIGINN